MKTVIIMRGVPGSGKSTFAKILAGKNGVIHSTDEYFYINGVYVFDPSILTTNHNLNFNAFCESLKANVPVVICDNTNVKRWHFESYVKAAKEHAYHVLFVTMPHLRPDVAASRTEHRVSSRTIQRMINEWEE